MSEERTTLEVIAPTVEEAIGKGLADLGLPENAVDIEILDTGSRGLFGLGSRQARIRLSLKQQEDLLTRPVTTELVYSKPAPSGEQVVGEEEKPAEEIEPETEEEQRELNVARDTVSELLEKMKVHARVTAHFVEPADPREQRSIMVEVFGDDLSILIGRRSETLNALQYISSLMVGKELERWIPLAIDVEGYRSRRERQLRQLARRMADQAVATGRRQSLEPMPASERRIIHLELRTHPQVYTESVGEEPNRKVTISLKK
ncbi:MAG: protein jag [Anaerolineaceae bacterium]|nr:protein jag [Anaerolineaceae bacterium]